MLTSAQQQQQNSEVQEIVKSLLKEDLDHDRYENRSVHRENLVRSVTIDTRQPTKMTLHSVSRNISGEGIGLITNEQIPDKCIAILSIEPLKKRTTKILAECRWCKPYGKNWFVSGWLFRTIIRGS